MRTVKEISDLTGISVRTLHYYDEIGLLKPTEKSDAGYRLYDDKALETLQQILFFREFDISLKEIKAVLDNPALERNQILQVQRKMLVTKKERMERLIASIDDILKGENKMDFTIFTKTEVEEMFQTMLEHMPENMRNIAIKEFGSIEQWKKHYMEVVSSEEMQKGYAKVVEWYGGKDKFLSVARTPVSKEVAESYNKRIEAILQKLIAKQNCDIDSFEVKELTALAGPVSNFLLALVLLFAGRLVYDYAPYSEANQRLLTFLLTTAILSLGLGLFNLIPVPPLDGSKVLFSLLPDRAYNMMLRYERYGMLLLWAVVLLGVGDKWMSAAIQWTYELFCRVVGF